MGLRGRKWRRRLRCADEQWEYFAVRAARASLGDEAFLTDTRRRIIASRTRITNELQRLGSHMRTRKPTLCSLTPAARWRSLISS